MYERGLHGCMRRDYRNVREGITGLYHEKGLYKKGLQSCMGKDYRHIRENTTNRYEKE